MKKLQKLRYKRRILIYSSLVLLIIFSIVDYYFETFGVPVFIKRHVKEKLYSSGFDIDFDVLKCGIVNGIVLTRPRLKDHQFSKDPLFTATKMRVSLHPDFSGSYFLSLNAFEIVDGVFNIPLFPDSGKEGKADTIRIDNVNAGISLTGTGLEIRYFSGKLEPFSFSASGSMKNIFLPIMSPPPISSSSEVSSSFSAIPTITSIPFHARANAFRKFLKIKEGKIFNGIPEFRLIFNIDAHSPESGDMKAMVNLPSFEYDGIVAKNVDAIISFRNRKFFLDKMSIKLSDAGELDVSGRIDDNTGLISGIIEGTLTPLEMSSFLKIAEVQLPAAMDVTKPISFKLNMRDFSINAMESKGKLNLTIPEACFKGVNMFDIKSDLVFSGKKVSATGLSFSTDRNNVSGNFDYFTEEQAIDASIQCSGPPLFIAKIMEGDEMTLMNDILSRFTFPENNKNIEISADVHCSWGDEFFYYITGNMVMHDFKYFDTAFNRSDARIIIDSNELLIIPMMTLQQKDYLATLAMVYDNSIDFKYHVNSPFFHSSPKINNRFLSEIQSSLPGKDVLNCIFPEWKSEALNMSDSINMKAGGIIDFSGEDVDRTDFKVNIFDSSCKWYALPVKQLNCDLIFKGMDMEISNVRGKVYNGDLSLLYKTNFDSEKGTIEVGLKEADFAPIAQHVKWNLKDSKGKLSIITNADFEYDDNENLLMTGDGNVKIRNANLWEVPIINEFGKLTSRWLGDRWGVLSDLDADFRYKKDHIYSDNIQTNGNVVALRSKGEYYWTTGNFDFIIHTEILKSVLPYKILSPLLDPITGLLENRVTRKNSEIKWKKGIFNEKIFKK